MGHCCFECGEKLVRGVSPTACSCVECYCKKCWDALFDDTFEPIQYQVYIKKGEEFVLVTKTLYESKECQGVGCPRCGVNWSPDDVKPY